MVTPVGLYRYINTELQIVNPIGNQFWLDPGRMALALDIVGMVDEWHKAGVPNLCA